ncbi:MAG: hypothetical protein M3Q03_02525 [Chloroflexota bacterium]|nr:hypothetical protein [Chloroflexota bacterium]
MANGLGAFGILLKRHEIGSGYRYRHREPLVPGIWLVFFVARPITDLDGRNSRVLIERVGGDFR